LTFCVRIKIIVIRHSKNFRLELWHRWSLE